MRGVKGLVLSKDRERIKKLEPGNDAALLLSSFGTSFPLFSSLSLRINDMDGVRRSTIVESSPHSLIHIHTNVVPVSSKFSNSMSPKVAQNCKHRLRLRKKEQKSALERLTSVCRDSKRLRRKERWRRP